MPGVADDVVKRTTLCHRECPADALVWLEVLLKLDVETRSKVKIVGLKNKSPSLKPTTTTPYRRQVNDGLKLSLVGGHDRTTLRRLLKKKKKGKKRKEKRKIEEKGATFVSELRGTRKGLLSLATTARRVIKCRDSARRHPTTPISVARAIKFPAERAYRNHPHFMQRSSGNDIVERNEVNVEKTTQNKSAVREKGWEMAKKSALRRSELNLV
ncbi:hypothetical protein V1478_011043, partial [Vespula squamosa]